MATREGYNYYLDVKKKLRAELESSTTILDIAIDYEWEAYEYLVDLAKSEDKYKDYTEKQMARKLAEDDTYWITTAQAEKTIVAIENFWNELNIPLAEREVFTAKDLLYGTTVGREVYDKYWAKIKEYYHTLRDNGYTGKEANVIIGKIMGSE